jgi:hypothetical protein
VSGDAKRGSHRCSRERPLIAIAPIVGTPRSVVAATNLADALGFALLELELAIEEAHAQDGE